MNEENTYYIQFSGKANIPEPLSTGHNFKVTSDVTITTENRKDNQDGTYDVTFKAVPVTTDILKDNGEIIKARDKRTMSQSLRNYAHYYWEHSEAITHPFEDLIYPKMMQKFMQMAPAIIRQVVKEIEDGDEAEKEF